jgi:hypothetical protein
MKKIILLFFTVLLSLGAMAQCIGIAKTMVCVTGTAQIYASCALGPWIWQVSTNQGATWTTLTNNSTYSGTSTSNLTISNLNPGMTGYLYHAAATSNPTQFSDSTMLIVSFVPPSNLVFDGLAATYCLGQSALYSVSGTGGLIDDSVYFSVNNANSLEFGAFDTTNLLNFVATGTVELGAFVTNGCGTASVIPPVDITVNPLQTTLAGVAGGGASCNTFTVYPGAANTYADGTCSPIASVTPSGASPVSGSVQSCVTVAASVPTYNGIPYVARYYDVEPATNPSTATATLTLYFMQADFDAYNASRGSYPALPTGPSDATGIGNVTISQFHGTGTTPGTYVGTTGTIVPTSVTWNSTASRWEITFSVTGFSGFFVSGSSIIPLPLTLVSFTGQSTTAGNVLYWETAMEENTANFDVQRQVAGENNFQAIATVPAAGNSDQPRDYTYTDALVGITGGAVSYRLKMTDLDGNFTYSRILLLGAASVSGLAVQVSPNPFHEPVSINVTVPEGSSAILAVTDVAGHRVAEQALMLQKGTTSVAPVILANLAPGVYFLSVVTDQGKQTIQVFKD